MMLLAPNALWWLLAAAPIVAIFLFRRRIVEVRIPALTFWEQMRRREAFGRWGRHLRRWAGLALHLLVLALLVGALTEPINPAYRHELLFVLDDSATMRTIEEDGRRRLAHAAELLLEKIREGPGGIQTTVFLAGTPPKILIDRETVTHKIQAALGSHESRDVNSDLEQALTLARRHRRDVETPIIVISDRRRADLAEQPDVEWLRIGRPQPNLEIADVRLSTDGAALDVFLLHSALSPRTATITLFSNQQTLISAQIMLLESPATVRLPAALHPGDPFEIRAEPADAFDLDNAWFGVCPPRRDVNLRLVSAGNEYLVAALDQPGTTLEIVSPDEWDVAQPTDLTIVDDPSGGPGRPAPGRYIVFGGHDPFGLCGSSKAQSNLTPLQWAVNHPLAADVDFLSWRIRSTGGLAPPAFAEMILGAADAPLVFVAHVSGKDAVHENAFAAVYVNFSLVDSNVVFRAGFPVFLWNAIDHLLDRRPEDYLTAQATGHPLVFAGVDKPAAAVLDPHGREAQAYFDGRRLTLPFPETAGFYQMNAGQQTWIRAANFRSDAAVTEESTPLAASTTLRSAQPRWWRTLPPWGSLAVIAGVLVLLEAILFHRGVLKVG